MYLTVIIKIDLELAYGRKTGAQENCFKKDNTADSELKEGMSTGLVIFP